MRDQSKTLRQDTTKLLRKLEIIQILEQYGDPHIVGSYVLDLMVWRDIDISLISESPTREIASKIASEIFSIKGFRKVSCVDETSGVKENKPKGIYIGAEYIDDTGNTWKFDIWSVTLDEDKSIAKTNELLEKISEEAKDKIISIKSKVFDSPNYRKNVTSIDIYEAVLDKGITDFEGFREHIQKTKGILL